MDSDLMLFFKTSLTNYLDSCGFKIKENAIKMLKGHKDDILIYSPQFADGLETDFIFKILDDDWKIPICSVALAHCKLLIKLNRPLTFTCGLKAIFDQLSLFDFGCSSFFQNKAINLICDCDNNFNDLTNYRMKLLTEVTKNLARAVGYSISEDDNTIQGLYFSSKSHLSRDVQSNNIIVCGPVLNSNKKTKEITVTVDQYRNMKKDVLLHRIENQNKYDDEVINLLADAIVKFGLLRVKRNSAVTLNFSNSNVGCSADSAIFILYNYSRLNAIIHEFESRVSEKKYPPLPSLEFVDFRVLFDEEWSLMFNFVLNFPTVIRSTVQFIEEKNPSPHLLCNFLYSLARTVSSYYRSTKILLEGKPYLLQKIYAKIYLIKAIHLMLRTSLKLLNIEVIPAL